MELPREILDSALDATGIDVLDYAIRTHYRGRGMFGDACAAVELEEQQQALQLLVALGAEFACDTVQALELARNARTDSLGTGVVLYFPEVELTDEDM